MKAIAPLVCLLAVSIAAAQDPAEARRVLQGPRRVVRSYPVGLAPLETAAETVRAMLSQGGTVAEDRANHRLVVYDWPEVQARVAEAVRALDVPGQNVRIEVTTRSERLAYTPDGETREDAATRQQLLVSSGGRASLVVAEDVPYLDWFLEWGRGRRIVEQSVAWQRLGTSLSVEPLVLGGGRIRVRVVPELRYEAEGRPGRVQVQELATEVVVREGDTVDLGGMPFSDRDFTERFFVGTSRRGERARTRVTLRASVQ